MQYVTLDHQQGNLYHETIARGWLGLTIGTILYEFFLKLREVILMQKNLLVSPSDIVPTFKTVISSHSTMQEIVHQPK